jgi:hypothetical protein
MKTEKEVVDTKKTAETTTKDTLKSESKEPKEVKDGDTLTFEGYFFKFY